MTPCSAASGGLVAGAGTGPTPDCDRCDAGISPIDSTASHVTQRASRLLRHRGSAHAARRWPRLRPARPALRISHQAAPTAPATGPSHGQRPDHVQVGGREQPRAALIGLKSDAVASGAAELDQLPYAAFRASEFGRGLGCRDPRPLRACTSCAAMRASRSRACRWDSSGRGVGASRSHGAPRKTRKSW